MRTVRVMRRRSGFSLIETVIAAAVLLLTCVAVGGTLGAVLRAESAVRERSALEQVLAAESARLSALPFFVPVAPPEGAAPGDVPSASLLAVVFPHAHPESNSPAAFYCDGPGPGAPGSFVTLVDADGCALRREARFVVGAGSEWHVVQPAALQGWAVWAGRQVPATTVEIALSTRSGTRTASTSLLLGAFPAAVALPSTPDDGGSQGG
jgi:type II secretory pathway pseudopilin PulG